MHVAHKMWDFESNHKKDSVFFFKKKKLFL